MSKSNEQKIELSISDQNFTFLVSRESYNKYINSVGPTNKVAPSHNFLISTVVDEDCERLKALIENNPGSEILITAEVLSVYMPDLNIVAKKSS